MNRSGINVLVVLDANICSRRVEEYGEAEYKKGNKSPILINVTMDVRFIALLQVMLPPLSKSRSEWAVGSFYSFIVQLLPRRNKIRAMWRRRGGGGYRLRYTSRFVFDEFKASGFAWNYNLSGFQRD